MCRISIELGLPTHTVSNVGWETHSRLAQAGQGAVLALPESQASSIPLVTQLASPEEPANPAKPRRGLRGLRLGPYLLLLRARV